MPVSVFDLFKIGIGPSSSHTVGPMRAARRFALRLREQGLLESTRRVQCRFYGSLAATGKGHGSDKAVILGLLGETPEDVAVEEIAATLERVRAERSLALLGGPAIVFIDKEDLQFLRREKLPFHPNGMEFSAFAADGNPLLQRIYYSVGGGFLADEQGQALENAQRTGGAPPFPFANCAQLLAHCAREQLSIADIVLANERVLRSEDDIRKGVHALWQVMHASITRGCKAEGTLPGGLKVTRRAASLHRKIASRSPATDPLVVLDYVNLYAIAVNEENAAGGRVVTAPTNGAAGIVPAVLNYALEFCRSQARGDVITDFLLTATAIGTLYKENASISGAEVGCQGEVGVACSMAAGALTAVLGGTPAQVENAAEIAMEHHLGLTCDPIGGLVQIPCIERNAIGAVKAINASRMALHGDGTHYVSLDKVIRTMRQTGADMHSKYKETSRGGLAVHIIEC